MNINPNYYKELSKLSQLNEEEIKAEALKLQLGDRKALDRIVEANLKLVVHISKKYQSIVDNVEIFEIGDLISEGNFGLIQAAQKFNPEFGVRFSYYASFWIQKAMIDFIVYNQSTIRTPYQKIKTDGKIRKKIDELFQQIKSEVSDEDVRKLGIFTDDEIEHYFNKVKIVGYEDYLELEEDSENNDFTEEQIRKMKWALNMLKPRYRKVIKLNFGIDCEKMNLTQIANELNVTKTRIMQIRNLALVKVKDMIK